MSRFLILLRLTERSQQGRHFGVGCQDIDPVKCLQRIKYGRRSPIEMSEKQKVWGGRLGSEIEWALDGSFNVVHESARAVALHPLLESRTILVVFAPAWKTFLSAHDALPAIP